MKIVEVETLRRWLAEGKPVTVVDVRPKDQRKEWQVPGSVHIDAYAKLRADDENALAGLELPRDRSVVTVCAADNASRVAADQLEPLHRVDLELDWVLPNDTSTF